MKRMMSVVAAGILLVGLLPGTACAAETGVYPYKAWEVTQEIADQGKTTSLSGYRWNTLYGTVDAPELKRGELRYWVYLPEEYDPDKEYPMVVYLHGSSVAYQYKNNYMTPWTVTLNHASYGLENELRRAMGDCIIFAPQLPGGKVTFSAGDAWSNMPGWDWPQSTVDNSGSSNYLKAAEKQMAQFIADGIDLSGSKYAVDMSRVYLIGDSMGAIGAYAMLVDCPYTFAGVTIRAGTGDPEMAYAWKDTPIRIFHGDQDFNVPYESSTWMINALKAYGAKDAERITVKDGGHDVRNIVYQSHDLSTGKNIYMSWLAEQVRTDAQLPQEVVLPEKPDVVIPSPEETAPEEAEPETPPAASGDIVGPALPGQEGSETPPAASTPPQSFVPTEPVETGKNLEIFSAVLAVVLAAIVVGGRRWMINRKTKKK